MYLNFHIVLLSKSAIQKHVFFEFVRKSKANISLFCFSKQLNSTGRIFELRMLVTIKLSLLEDYFRTQLHVLNYCVLMSLSLIHI